MPTIEPLVPGIYARSQRLVQTTRDHDRDRVDDEALHEDQVRDLENLLGVQRAAGVTQPSPGLLTWQDLFRPFRRVVPQLEAETLTRFVDTNTFYRRPDLDGEPTLGEAELGGLLEDHVPRLPGTDGLGTLPAPSAWVAAARDEDHGYPDAATADAVAEDVYPAIVEAHAERGYSAIALSDPWLAGHPEPGALAGSLATLADAVDADVDLLAHLPFQDASPLLADVAETPVDGVLVDLVETPRSALDDLPGGLDVGLGLVDARSSLVERPDLVLEAVADALDRVDPGTVYLTPTGDLQHVPEAIARRKVRVTGQAARAAQDKLGGDDA